MSVRVAINGFGRIGRQSLKAIIERHPELEVVAVNDLADTELNALLFAHDSTYGRYPGSVDHTEDSLIVDGRQIKVLKEKDPAALPWRDLNIEMLSHYRHRDWAAALATIEQGRSFDEEGRFTTLYDVYSARIRAFQLDPPPDDWAGAYALDTK